MFRLHENASPPWNKLVVWPDPAISEGMFSPLGTDAVAAPVETIEVDKNYVVASRELLRGVPYSVYHSACEPPGAPDAERLERCRSLPEDLDPRVRQLAENIMAGSESTSERIDAITGYFHGNYDYSLGVRIPADRDPVTYFLLERPSAHCEFFAAGAALLLRAGGVPARYVSGFVVTGRNPYGDYWYARHADAHAWVEAYVPGNGWTIVEATPSSGQPRQNPPDRFGLLWDYLRQRMQELMVAIRTDGFRGGLGWFWSRLEGLGRLFFSASRTAQILKPLAVLLLVGSLLWLRRRKERGHQAEMPRGPVARLHHLLEHMDARLEKHGLKRRPDQTLHDFARRVRSAKDLPGNRRAVSRWYHRYARIRYGTDMSPAEVKKLRESMPSIG
jgi:hypothetical protein